MSTAETKRCKAILRAALDADGQQLGEIQLHADANLIFPMTATEFAGALALCDARRWLTGVTSRHNRTVKLWNINDRGEAALTEL